MVGRSRLTKRRKVRWPARVSERLWGGAELAIGEAVVDDLIRAGQLPGDETHLGSAAAGAPEAGGRWIRPRASRRESDLGARDLLGNHHVRAMKVVH
jgi:hypothetical protein